MDVRFYIDPETGDSHLHGHGVSEQEVVEHSPTPSRIALLVKDPDR